MSPSANGPRWLSSSARICGQRLPQLPLFAIGLTMILVFTGTPRRASVIVAEPEINRKENPPIPSGQSREERDLLGLAHAPDRRQGVVGRNLRLSHKAARDDRRAE